MNKKKTVDVAYFSMEFALMNEIRNYAGGLGVLAADAMHSCADMGIRAVGVSLIYHRDDDPQNAFPIQKFLKRSGKTVSVTIENREVKLSIWRLKIEGDKGNDVPMIFLSAYLPENPLWDRNLTKNLYAADQYTRLCQEILLGVGGVRALEALGYTDVRTYHLNEGHCSFLTLELLRRYNYDEDAVRARCTFTTHTPIPSGHDYFDYDLVYRTAGDLLPLDIRELATQDRLGMTQLALSLCGKANGVSRRHAEVCRAMFPGKDIFGITNGVYHPRWIGSHMQSLFDMHVPHWRRHPKMLKRYIDDIPGRSLQQARKHQKKELVSWVNKREVFFPFEEVQPADLFEEGVLTIGFARRFVQYKRPELIFQQLETLRRIGTGKLQLIFAGRCNPADDTCNTIMRDIEEYTRQLRGEIRIALVPEYNIKISKRLVSGCDIWLNTPIPPQEASGTSGMKAAMNGCLNLSILDGWWIEGFEQNSESGWAFGSTGVNQDARSDQEDANDLMLKLEDVIDCYENRKSEWVRRMKASICLAGYFNTHRMVKEYRDKMWSTEDTRP